MRTFVAALLAASIVAPSAFAAGTADTNNGTLAPGKPAGVDKAQVFGMAPGVALLAGATIIGGAVLLGTSNSNSSTPAPGTTGTGAR